MAAKWSEIWSKPGLTKKQKSLALKVARFVQPLPKPKKAKGGQYPCVQPFFRNKVASS